MRFEDFLRLYGPLRAPDDDGGGGDNSGIDDKGGDDKGGDDQGGDDKGGDDKGGDQDQHGKDETGDPYRPDWLPEKMAGKTDRETLERVGEAWKQQRETLSKQGTVPDKPDGYAIELSEATAKAFPIGDDDPVMPILKEVAHEFGLRDQQIGFVPKLMDRLVEAGVVQPPMDIGEIYKKAAPADFQGNDAEREAAGQKRVQSLEHQIDGLTASGFSKEEAGELKLLLTTSDGISALNRVLSSGMQKSVNPGGHENVDGITKASLRERQADPRNDRHDAKYDNDYAKETERQYRKFYGN